MSQTMHGEMMGGVPCSFHSVRGSHAYSATAYDPGDRVTCTARGNAGLPSSLGCSTST
jgi:hypothetical protein